MADGICIEELSVQQWLGPDYEICLVSRFPFFALIICTGWEIQATIYFCILVSLVLYFKHIFDVGGNHS